MKLLKTVAGKIDFFVFCASVFTLSQSIKLSSKLLFIALVLGVLKSIYRKDFTGPKKHRYIIITYTVFFSYICLQGIFIDGASEFFTSFEKHYAPYLVFLLTPFLYRDEKQVKILPKVFIAGLFFTFFLIIFMSLIQLDIYDRTKVLEVFDLHHLYMSLYILFAANYLLARLSNKQPQKTNALEVLILIVLTGFLMLFKSKAAIVIFVGVLIYYAISKVKRNVLVSILLIASLCVLVIVFNNFFLELYLIALDFRLRIWEAATTAISQNSIFGYGAPNEYLQLDTVHFLKGDYDFLDSNYNAHNQYLSFLIRFGVIGFFLVVATYIIPLFKIKKSIKKEYIGFLLIVGFMAFIESLFNRHHGIVFCTIMLYYYNTMSKNEL